MRKKYDSYLDTLHHIRTVQRLLLEIVNQLIRRGFSHDMSKLESPEKEMFDEFTPKLARTTYGSDEYKELLKELGVALKHHYENNSHHPEHYENGANDMTLLDIIEMFCDWKAATQRHNDGNFETSIDYNKHRFNISNQLHGIFQNTRKELDW